MFELEFQLLYFLFEGLFLLHLLLDFLRENAQPARGSDDLLRAFRAAIRFVGEPAIALEGPAWITFGLRGWRRGEPEGAYT